MPTSSTRLAFSVAWPAVATAYAIAVALAVDAIGRGQVDPDDDLDVAEWIALNRSSEAVFDSAKSIHDDVGTDTGCLWSVDATGHLSVRDFEGSAAVDAIAAVIRAALRKFGSSDCVAFAWADTCSPPVAGAFGGGAAVVTRHSVETVSTAVWMQRQVARLAAPARAAA